jgi:hypothetical protein
MPYIDDIFSTKDISESSKKLYMRNISKLNNNEPINDLIFLGDLEAIQSRINRYKPTTKRSFIIAIICLIKEDKDLYKKYYDILTSLNHAVKIDTFKGIYTIH